MQVIDQINGSALFAQSAYSAAVATKDDLGRDITATYLTSHQDLSDYYTKSQTSGADELAQAFSNIPLGDEAVNSAVHELSGTWNEVSSKLDTTAFNLPDSATWNEVSIAYQNASATYLTAIDIPESATWNETSNVVQSNSAQWGQGGTTYTSPSGTILINGDTLEGTNSAISIVGYEGFVSSYGLRPVGPNDTARYTWDKALPTNIITLDTWATSDTLYWSANTDLTGEIVLPEAGRTTQSISIPNATAFAAWSNNYHNINGATVSAADTFETVVGELAWASALPTYQYDSSNKISAINGSAIAGQGGNPEVESYVQTTSANIDDTVTSYQTNSGDYLKESELGYNAVDEVSAINGSAIAQYGAEKQWLVHDDTLVHAANSAQYALGVNLSAVAQLLGVDETVLFSGNRAITASGQLNTTENPYNFNKVEIWAKSHPDYTDTLATTFKYDSVHSKVPFMSLGINDVMGAVRFNISRIEKNASGFNIINQKQFSITGNATSTANSPTCITKIIGIGRKQ